MNVTENREIFDRCQVRFTRELAHAVRNNLSQTGLADDRIRRLTETIVFDITNLIDGGGAVEADGCTFFPNLTFTSDEDEARHIGEPAGSGMHEYAHGVVDDIFENPSA